MKKINKFCNGYLIMCGEFNIVPDNSLDTSSSNTRLTSPMGTFIRNNDLYDVWRCHHSTERDYSFFSHQHNSYTRIDFFLVDKWTLAKVSDSSIATITWSDHAPVSITTDNLSSLSRTKCWRANASILHSSEHSTVIQNLGEKTFANIYCI